MLGGMIIQGEGVWAIHVHVQKILRVVQHSYIALLYSICAKNSMYRSIELYLLLYCCPFQD